MCSISEKVDLVKRMPQFVDYFVVCGLDGEAQSDATLGESENLHVHGCICMRGSGRARWLAKCRKHYAIQRCNKRNSYGGPTS